MTDIGMREVFMHIIVLSGGESAEREISLRSGARVAAALREAGHEVKEIDYTARAENDAFFEKCRAADAVFLALHGGAGEDGSLQATLERAGVRHYTGTGPRGSALAMHKSRAKAVVSALGVPVAKGFSWRAGAPAPAEFSHAKLPLVAKPEAGGSSVGLTILRSREEAEKFAPSGDYLCEEYLPGREFSVGILGARALPPVQLVPADAGLYDYAHKYTPGATEERCPAPLPAGELAELQNLALVAFAGLSLSDYARVDFKEDGAGRFCFLEANTLPGMTETSLLPLAARTAGIPFPALCDAMARAAAGKRAETKSV